MKTSRISIVLVLLAILITLPGYIHGTVSDRSGFIHLDPVNYYFHNGSRMSRIHHNASGAQMWYTFLTADRNPEQKPLFLFFNGGPGSGTTCGLLGFYTARKTLDNRISGGGDTYMDNPFPWTGMGNLLYIDARCTGLSYGLLGDDQPRNRETLAGEFTGKNFNSYIDAADYIRVLIKFLKERPAIRKNPVVIVGESYGGVRATLILHILLNYRGYGNGTEIYQDPELAGLIQEHYDSVFPQYRNREVPPEVIIRQFGHQVLIQPAIDSYQNQIEINLMNREDSVVYQVAEEVGETFVPCTSPDCDPLSNIYDFIESVARRDLYGCHKPIGWTDAFFDKGGELMSHSVQAGEMTNFDITQIDSMYAASRERGYKFVYNGPENTDLSVLPEKERYLIRSKMNRLTAEKNDAPPSDFPVIFGNLNPWDGYYLSLNWDANYTYHYFNASVIRNYPTYSYNPLTGRKFLQNLIHVKTFITNARYDLVVFTNALPLALNEHTDIVALSTHLRRSPGEAERPGLIEVRYREGAFGLAEDIGTRIIRFPYYIHSSHPVSLTEPEAFLTDVRNWMNDLTSGGIQ